MTLNVEIIGLVAAVLTTSAFIPQVVKTRKTKDVENLSLSMYLVMLSGVLLWLVYGIYIQSTSIILANILTSGLVILLLSYKIRFTNK